MVTTPSTSPLPFCTRCTTWPLTESIRLDVALLIDSAKVKDCTVPGVFTVNDAAKASVSAFEVGEPATATCDPITGMKLSSTASCGPIHATIVTGVGVGAARLAGGIATDGVLTKTIVRRTSGV